MSLEEIDAHKVLEISVMLDGDVPAIAYVFGVEPGGIEKLSWTVTGSNDALLYGTGTGQPVGIIDSGAV